MALLPGGDVLAVVRKLAKGVDAISQGVAAATGTSTPFAAHPILGMITCCPTNLGTGCRASVMIELPNLMKSIGLEGLDKIAHENHCQVRGSTGEFSEVTQGSKVDISNRYRLGYSEMELVSAMIRTVNLLVKMEIELEVPANPYQDLIMDADLARNMFPAAKVCILCQQK
jgi:protein-arginine kinase